MPNIPGSPNTLAMVALLSWCLALPVLVKGLASCANFSPPLIFQGKQIYNSITNAYVPIKGVNYYPRPNTGSLTQTNSIDFVTEEYRSVWERDIEYFKRLNVNVVRLYAVEPGQNHDGFMCALKAAGIYAIVGLAADCENCAITKDAAPACYPAELKQRGQFIISEFARYDNVLGFSAGNEISLSAGSVDVNGACQKQFIRDMRSYVKGCSETIRQIPIGLAIADIEREEKTLWYSCRSDPDDDLENAEFIGLNSYLHCDGRLAKNDPLLGFEMLLRDFEQYQIPMPAMLTEFGCVDASFEDGQRDFEQVDALFSDRYRKQFVGGVVFEYSTESINSLAPYPFSEYGEGNFGLGHFQPENCDDIEIPCQYAPFPQFNVLSNKYAAVDTSLEPSLSDLPGEQRFPACPVQLPSLRSFEWASDSVPDKECPGKVYVTCPGVPNECTGLGVPFQAASPTTAAPQVSAETRLGSKIPTLSPTSANLSVTSLPTTNVSSFDTSDPQNETNVLTPLASPTSTPTISLGVDLISSQNPTRLPTGEPIVVAIQTEPTTSAPTNTKNLISSPFPTGHSEGETPVADDQNEESSTISFCSSIPLLFLLFISLTFYLI